jgi:hypothetical protein
VGTKVSYPEMSQNVLNTQHELSPEKEDCDASNILVCKALSIRHTLVFMIAVAMDYKPLKARGTLKEGQSRCSDTPSKAQGASSCLVGGMG